MGRFVPMNETLILFDFIIMKLIEKKEEVENKSITLCELAKLAKQMPKPQFIWNGIQEASFGYILGPSKTGKTTLCENLGMSIASGKSEFLGLPINIVNRKVVFLSFEEYWLPRTLRNIKQSSKVSLNGDESWTNNYVVANIDFPQQICGNQDWAVLENTIAINKPGIVFIDSLTRIVEGQVEDVQVAKRACIKYRELSNKYKCAIVCVHHTPKLNGKEITLDSIAGSRVFAQEADFAIGVNKSAAGLRYIKNVFLRYEDDSVGEVKTFTIDDSLWINITGAKSEQKILCADDGRVDDTNREIIIQFLKQKLLIGQTVVSASELMTDLVDTKKMVKSTLYDCIDVLVAENEIVRVQKGLYSLNKGRQAA